MRCTQDQPPEPARPAPRPWSRIAVASLIAAALAPSGAQAGKARDYLNAPVNTWVTFYNLGWRSAISPVPGGQELGFSEITNDTITQSVIGTRILDFWGRTGGVSVIVPWARIGFETGDFTLQEEAIGDLGFAWEVNLFGAPALSREAFRNWVPETFASFHLVVTAPTGDFDASAPVNVGSDRWTVTPTINYSYTPDAGSTWIEGYASVKFFSDSDALSLEQDPLLLLEAHASRNVSRDLWFSADAYWDLGGSTTRSGVDRDDGVNTLRLGAGLGLRAWKGAQVMLNTERIVSAREGQADDGWGVRLSLAQVW